MAVVDKYTNADVEAGKKGASALVAGNQAVCIRETVEVAAGDDDGSVYRLFASVPSNYIPYEISVHNDAVTGGTDYDLGLYKANRGAVVDADVLMDGQSMASARAMTAGWNVGLQAVDVADGTKTLAELSGQTDPYASYDIALTANTVGTAAGTITVTAIFLQA